MQTFKKIIPLLSLSLAIFAFTAQSLLAGEITVKNNSDAHLFISFMKADETQWRTTPSLKPKGGSAKSPSMSLTAGGVLGTYNHSGDLAYHLGLDMKANNENPADKEPYQIYSNDSNDNISWDSLKNGTKLTNTHTFITVKKADGSDVIRNLSVIFEYNKTTDQLNVTIK